MRKSILTTVHGSHLYGLATPESDFDTYTIYLFTNKNYRPRKLVKQKITDFNDATEIYLHEFHKQVEKGVPQALEVLFAPKEAWLAYQPEWLMWQEVLKYTVKENKHDILKTYKRTASSFFKKDDFKKNRHAFRLLHNAAGLVDNDEFNSRLNKEQIEDVNKVSKLPWNEKHNIFKDRLYQILG